jgi:hypothetical protein
MPPLLDAILIKVGLIPECGRLAVQRSRTAEQAPLAVAPAPLSRDGVRGAASILAHLHDL